MEEIKSIPQLKLIHSSDWDNLIVLDDCRFDFFAREYKEFLKGRLIEAISPATCTKGWLEACWSIDAMHDITYISGSPYITSVERARTRDLSCWTTKQFTRVIDVWTTGMDKSLEAVPPWAINEATKKGFGEGRHIIHYLQPHIPFIAKFQMDNKTWNPLEITWGKATFEMRRAAYRANLRLVLKHVAELLPLLKGKTVVTSDHGELLGESAYGGDSLKVYGHRCYWTNPVLFRVPWLKVES